MQQYLKILKRYKRMPVSMMRYLEEQIRRIEVARGTIISTTTLDGYIFFIEKGLIAETDITEGRRYINGFKKEGQFVIDYRKSVRASGNHIYDLETMEDCILWIIPEKASDYLSEHFHEFNYQCTTIMMKDWVKSSQRKRIAAQHSAAARYDFLKMDNPGLLTRVPLKELAIYMQTTESALTQLMKGKAIFF